MLKKLTILAVAAMLSIGAFADSYTFSTDALSTNTEFELSGNLPISGWLDKIEVWQDETLASTATVTVASYAGSTAIDTFYTASVNQSSLTDVARPRIIGTTTAGVDLSGVVVLSPTNAATTVLTAAYDRPMLGGNIKALVTLTTPGTVTNTVTVRIFYDPTAK